MSKNAPSINLEVLEFLKKHKHVFPMADKDPIIEEEILMTLENGYEIYIEHEENLDNHIQANPYQLRDTHLVKLFTPGALHPIRQTRCNGEGLMDTVTDLAFYGIRRGRNPFCRLRDRFRKRMI